MINEYRPPLLLEQLIKWDLENPTGLFLGIDFNEKNGYFCTPVDSFSFARTGMDGIHFVLLTDFGLVKDLNEVPVIGISPMDSERVRIVARNLSNFFSLHFFDELLLLNEYSSEDLYFESISKELVKDRNSKCLIMTDGNERKRWF
ncbi:hypothetical protein ASG89_33795 [Paenibacillus sp. Soil766]|uniref:hypothetical protein n=1 Tax=Paenibacillus sp. Soil766 TaxID=1736404 RepID=UPI0007107922|nr:hypothetical protein [Paenibacillus sp. Soil766]KRE92137.1 hypothetical protein ASG89_33795 [Paenibacillus sp. Soil766]